MGGLRQKLERQGLENITYMVVNHQGEDSQRLHGLLKQSLPENITLYQQEPGQADVWKALDGEKDDFLLYDRCGRLTYHISLPYSILGTSYVEDAIRETYCRSPCGDCKNETSEVPAECNRTAEAKPEGGAGPPATGEESAQGRHHHHHGHGHGHRHRHHGDGGVEEERQGHGHHGQSGVSHGGGQQQHDHLNVGQEHGGQQAMQHQVMQKP